MRTALAIAIGLLAVALPAETEANTSNSFVNRSLEIASDYWGTNKSCADVEFLRKPFEAGSFAEPAIAMSDLGGCSMWLDVDHWGRPTASPAQWCQNIVHEYGHLLGHEHSEGGVMGTGWNGRYVPACFAEYGDDNPAGLTALMNAEVAMYPWQRRLGRAKASCRHRRARHWNRDNCRHKAARARFVIAAIRAG